MAKGTKTGGKNFEKGNTHGKGRPLIPTDLKSVRKLSSDEAQRLIVMFASMTPEELVQTIKDPKTPAMHSLLCNIILKGISGGDSQRMEFLFSRTIGKVLEKVELSMPKPFLIKRPDGSIMLGAKDDDDERS